MTPELSVGLGTAPEVRCTAPEVAITPKEVHALTTAVEMCTGSGLDAIFVHRDEGTGNVCVGLRCCNTAYPIMCCWGPDIQAAGQPLLALTPDSWREEAQRQNVFSNWGAQ